jgi:hypothetical protein
VCVRPPPHPPIPLPPPLPPPPLAGDGRPELLVGTADADIRCLKGADLDAIVELTEGDAVSCLADVSCGGVGGSASLPGPSTISIPSTTTTATAAGGASRLWAYGLANGSVGVYSCSSATSSQALSASVGSSSSSSSSAASSSSPGGGGATSCTRLWRLKAKGKTTAVASFDFDRDGFAEVACGWATGRLEIRRAQTGELLFRDTLPAGVAGLAVADYRGDGRPVLLAVSGDGEVRAYAQVDAATVAAHRRAAGLIAPAPAVPAPPAPVVLPVGGSGGKGGASSSAPPPPVVAKKPDAVDEEAEILASIAEKARLEAEVRAYQAAAEAAEAGSTSSSSSSSSASSSSSGTPTVVLPAGSQLSVSVAFNVPGKRLELVVTASAPSSSGGGSGGGPPQQPTPLSLRAACAFAPDAPFFPPGREAVLAVPPPAAGAVAMATTGAALGGLYGGVRDTPSLLLPLTPASLTPAELRVQALVGERASAASFAALESVIKLPRFALFQLVGAAAGGTTKAGVRLLAGSAGATMGSSGAAGPSPFPLALPTGTLSFTLPERAARVAGWISSAFLVPDGAVQVRSGAGSGSGGGGMGGAPLPALLDGSNAASLALDVRFVCLRDGGRSLLRIAVQSEHGGPAVVQCEDLELAGAVVHDLAAHLSLATLESTADFPADFAAVREAIARLAEATAVRTKLTGEMAEGVGIVKVGVIQAEDARLRCDMGGMRKSYAELRGRGGDLLREYKKRSGNHAALVDALRSVNAAIGKAAGVRVGEPRARVVAACRAAIKANNFGAMLQVMR